MRDFVDILIRLQPPVVIVLWAIAGLAVLVALRSGLRRQPRTHHWSRAWAVSFPLGVALSLVAGSIAAQARAEAFNDAMFLRTLGLWICVAAAPTAVGQLTGVRPPRWLLRTHAGLAAGHLLLFATTNLVFTHPLSANPSIQPGPLSLAFLLPVAALAGWWLLGTLSAATNDVDRWLLAFGGSTTTLALLVGALGVRPELSDHMLTVGFLPLLGAAELVALHAAWTSSERSR